MRTLTPLVLRERYFLPIEKEIQRIFNLLIYIPLAKAIPGKDPLEVRNATAGLIDGIRALNIWYEDGQFKGQFSARISRDLKSIGARFSPASKSFSLKLDMVPYDVRFALADADSRIAALRKKMLSILDGIDVAEIPALSTAPEQYGKTVEEMQKDFAATTAAITIAPQLTDVQRAIISKEWGTNLDLYIQGWAEENIIKLRTQVQSHVLAGGRAEGMVKMLQESYGTSKKKAKFLARQETSLLMSKFQETRYGDIGITKYRWSTSKDERVRHDHKLLDGNVFSFSQPPVTNRETGARNNPGQDYGCRCIAIPLVE